MSSLAILIATAALIVATATRRFAMTAIERLKETVTRLNTAITEETAQQKKLVDEIRAGIADDAAVEDINALADQLDASIARVKAIVPDETETPGEAPIES